jgi:tripartite-type tricarboxylate transporter receptor subunit TctC
MFLARLLVVAGTCLVAQAALAQAFPQRAVRIIVPFSAGGAVDVPARLLAHKLADSWAHGVVVDNRPGAGSTIGAAEVARAPADGHVLLLTSNTHVISGGLYDKLGYDPIRDFLPVMEIGHAPNVLVVHPSFPAKTVAELVALAKAKPDTIDYASSGNGSSQHLFGALMFAMAGVRANHVPYKGSCQATNDLLAGRVPVSFPGINNVLAHIKAGKLRALAVTSGKRSPELPEVPTIAEAGIAGYEATLWLAILAPAATPKEVAARIQADTLKALAQEDVKQGFAKTGTEIEPRSAAQLSERLRAELARWAKLIRESGAKVD